MKELYVKFLSRVIFSCIILIGCSTHIVKVERETVRIDTLSQNFNLELVSEPTLRSPTAEFISLKVVELKEISREITTLKRRPYQITEYCLGGLSLGLILLAYDMNERGFPQYAGPTLITAFLPLIGIGILRIGSHINWQRVKQTERVYTEHKPCAVDVLSGAKNIATLHPTAERRAIFFNLYDFLDILPKDRDLKLIANLSDNPKISCSFNVERNIILGLHRQRLVAEIDTICQVIEGFNKDGIGLSTCVVLPLLMDDVRFFPGGYIMFPDTVKIFAKKNIGNFERCKSIYKTMRKSDKFGMTYKNLNYILPVVSRFVEVNEELILYGTLISSSPEQYLRIWRRALPGGRSIIAKEIERPFKGELKNLGLSNKLIDNIWYAVILGNWTGTPLGISAQRDSLLKEISNELKE